MPAYIPQVLGKDEPEVEEINLAKVDDAGTFENQPGKTSGPESGGNEEDSGLLSESRRDQSPQKIRA